MTLKEKAEFCLTQFEKRENKYYLVENSSSYVSELVYKAHEEMLPDDFKYSVIVEVLELLANYNIELDYIQDLYFEMEADIYTYDLTSWLNSNNSRLNYITEILEENFTSDGFELLQAAQLREKENIFNIVLNYLENEEI